MSLATLLGQGISTTNYIARSPASKLSYNEPLHLTIWNPSLGTEQEAPRNRRISRAPTRAYQVQPDFSPRAPSGPGGDAFRVPFFTSVLAARTRSSSAVATENSEQSQTSRPNIGGTTGGTGSAAPAPTSHAKNTENGTSQPRANRGETGPPLSTHSSGLASATNRLWRHFSILSLDAPSTAELRTVFAHACSDSFGGDGPASSVMIGGGRRNSSLLSGEVIHKLEKSEDARFSLYLMTVWLRVMVLPCRKNLA